MPIDHEDLETALYAMADKKQPKTVRQALNAGRGVLPDDDDIAAFAKKIELFLGEIDDDVTIPELRDALHTFAMK